MTPRRRSVAITAALAASMVLSAVQANAGVVLLDLSGTWTGTIKCKSFLGGVKDKFTLTPTMRIAQNGSTVGVLLDYGGGDTEQYTARVTPDAKKFDTKGELAVLFCGSNDQVGDEPTYDELGRIGLKVKPLDVKGSFKGTSVFSDPGVLGDTEAGTCKWSFKRTAADLPMVPLTCAP